MRFKLPFLFILLFLTGCAVGPLGGPSEQEQPVALSLNNSANVTQTFEVWVATSEANVTIRLNDSRTVNTSISQGLTTASSGDYYYYTAVEPSHSAQIHGRFTVEPGEERQSSIENFSLNSVVVVVLYQDNKSGWWASAYCSDGALIGLGVTSRPDQYSDAEAGYGCR
jgi:hypothetical protein